MATTIMMVKEGFKLSPAFATDAEAFDKLSNATYSVMLTQPRSLPRLRFYWAVMNAVYENSDEFLDSEAVSDYIKMKLGYVRWIVYPNGSVSPRVRSISFANMDEDKFSDFVSKALDVICNELLPGTDPADLWDIGAEAKEQAEKALKEERKKR